MKFCLTFSEQYFSCIQYDKIYGGGGGDGPTNTTFYSDWKSMEGC